VKLQSNHGGAVLEIVEWAGGSASISLESEVLKQQPVAVLELAVEDAATTAAFEVDAAHLVTTLGKGWF
jgi:hypothetical protein